MPNWLFDWGEEALLYADQLEQLGHPGAEFIRREMEYEPNLSRVKSALFFKEGLPVIEIQYRTYSSNTWGSYCYWYWSKKALFDERCPGIEPVYYDGPELIEAIKKGVFQ